MRGPRHPLAVAFELEFDRDAPEGEIGIDGLDTDGDRLPRRHLHDGLGWLDDPHLGHGIRDDVDPMLDAPLPSVFLGPAAGPEDETVVPLPGPGAVGREPQFERAARPREVAGGDLQLHEPLPVAAEVDRRHLQRILALREQRHLRSLEAAHVPLPLEDFGLTAGVRRRQELDLLHEQRRRIDDDDPDRLALRIARRHRHEEIVREPVTAARKRRFEATATT